MRLVIQFALNNTDPIDIALDCSGFARFGLQGFVCVFRIMRHQGGLRAAGSHPAMFPVALVEAVLTAFSDPGDLFYEPFCGSGTQIVAAERAGRRCFAMELGPAYCDMAVRRDGETASATKLDSFQAKQPTRRVDLPRSVAPKLIPIDLSCFF